MKLLIVTQYYWPEFFLINRLSQKLYESGHQVTVITGKPNYPEGVIYHGYKAMGVQREDYEGVEVIRIPLMPRRKGAFGLILNYVSFVLSGMWYMPRLLKGRQFDAILVYAPSPITTTIPAIFMKRKLGAHLALWVQDLWLHGVEANEFRNFTINENNEILLETQHFYGKNIINMSEEGRIKKGEFWKCLNYYSLMLRGFSQVAEYSKKVGTKIYNHTKTSYIDSFDKN